MKHIVAFLQLASGFSGHTSADQRRQSSIETWKFGNFRGKKSNIDIILFNLLVTTGKHLALRVIFEDDFLQSIN